VKESKKAIGRPKIKTEKKVSITYSGLKSVDTKIRKKYGKAGVYKVLVMALNGEL
jgi:hypothetical protein